MRKIYNLICYILFYIATLSFIYIVHINYFKVDVVLYSAIFDSILAATIASAATFFIRSNTFTKFEKTLISIIFFLLGYIISITIPTIIDRSLSFYILEKIQQRGGGIKLQKFEDIFVKEYLKEHRLIDVRLTEQLKSGNIIIDNNCVRLTEQGNRLATMSRYFRQHYLPKKRLLMNDYTDDLTNPFRNSSKEFYYGCD